MILNSFSLYKLKNLCKNGALWRWLRRGNKNSNYKLISSHLNILIWNSMISSWFTLQSLLIAWFRAKWKAKTTTNTNNIHISAVKRTRTSLSRDTLSRYLHSWGDSNENRPNRSKSSGESTEKIINFGFIAKTDKREVKNWKIFAYAVKNYYHG